MSQNNAAQAPENALLLEVLESCLNTGIYITDADTYEILYMNGQLCSLYGFDKPEDCVGQKCYQAFMGNLPAPCASCMNKEVSEEGKRSVSFELYSKRARAYMRVTNTLITWLDGRKAVFHHMIDITQSKQIETILQRNVDYQAAIADVSQYFASSMTAEDIFVKTLEKVVLFMDVDAACMLTKEEEHSRFSLSYYELRQGSSAKQPPQFLPYDKEGELYKRFQKGEPWLDSAVQTVEESLMPQESRQHFAVTPILLRGDVWALLYCTAQRASGWREEEIEFLRVVSRVFASGMERLTVEQEMLQRDRELEKSAEEAQRANIAKSEFLARMSHEIRTPMNAIIGMTGIAQKSDDADKKDACLGKIDSASRHLLGVINDILDMSKIEANKFDILPAPFDFERMLMNTTGMISFRVDEKNHDFVVKMGCDIPHYVVGDEQRLAQVLTNLLSNAVKFTPQGGHISLNVQKTAEDGNVVTLLFEVEDNGIGISKEQQKKLFNAFEQADGGMARKYEGTGLGLVISKRIVELMGGSIWLESEEGQGTKISFSIPAEKGEAVRKVNLHRGINHDNLNILVVDDSADVREYFSYLLETLHLPCDVVASGEEALAKMQAQTEKPYNLFFVDWMMPGMDGIELTAKIKEVSQHETVVIMISAARWSEIEKEATRAGAQRYIGKPLFPSAVINCINECLGIQSVKRPHGMKPQAPAKPSFAGKTLLLVEDIEVNREIVIALLEDTALEVVCAENGAEALRIFSESPHRIDLVFMDIHMPVMDGYEATRSIRALPGQKAQDVPIIAMTANAFKEDVERCLQCGMNDHIAKPIDYQIMLDKLMGYLPQS